MFTLSWNIALVLLWKMLSFVTSDSDVVQLYCFLFFFICWTCLRINMNLKMNWKWFCCVLHCKWRSKYFVSPPQKKKPPLSSCVNGKVLDQYVRGFFCFFYQGCDLKAEMLAPKTIRMQRDFITLNKIKKIKSFHFWIILITCMWGEEGGLNNSGWSLDNEEY